MDTRSMLGFAMVLGMLVCLPPVLYAGPPLISHAIEIDHANSLPLEAIALREDDPEMEFAAALVTLSAATADHFEHLTRTLAAATTDRLLAQNLCLALLWMERSQPVTNRSVGGVSK